MVTSGSSREELLAATENLYCVFSKYQSAELAPAPSCTEDQRQLDSVRQSLEHKDIRELAADDLLDYYYLAIEHIGSIDDVRHLLPRILETLIGDPRLLAPAHLPRLLRSANFSEWLPAERDAVVRFVRAAGRTIPEDVTGEVTHLAGSAP